ncbi:PQQ-dependent sugar dehydrogenase [Kutzneria albida]|uniref:Glucose/sorbosone dehydrogenase n=1 Tax=Kutzneria albida DSM 43870 TaxID=1449976 RepID=W5WDP5_9PSEU|nr:glucose/sorbosone dehydrogenase [Kutzneria albida DSM 43870]
MASPVPPRWRVALACAISAATAFAVAPAAHAASAEYEAENATISKGVVESNHAGYSGTGFVNYDNVAGSYVEFTVNSAQAGSARLDFRFANGTGANRPVDVTVNGTTATSNLAFPGTGDWTNWQVATTTVNLKAGANKVRAAATGAEGGPNLDKLTVTTGSGDSTPPTAPRNLVVSDIGPNSATFTWQAATDDTGVVRYEVNRGGNVLKTVDGATLTTTVTTLTPNTAYDISVGAFDAAGNASQQSNVVQFTTPPSNDKTPPSAPGDLRSTGVTANSVSLAWNASTDDGGVIAGYDVYQGSGKVASTSSTDTTVTDLAPSTDYTFTVKARDPNGNNSAASNAVTVKTTGGGTGAGGIPEYDRDITKLDLPWGIDFLPDGSALVAERDRFEIVRVTADGQKTVLGKVPGAVTTNGEGGVMGLAVSPHFATDHTIYVDHTAADDNRIVKMTYDNGKLSTTSTPVLTGIAKNRYHNGGRLRFGPDGKLYATAGDAKNSANAQNKNSLNGKVLRLNPDGSAPTDNPFYSSGGNARYVWSMGHRNPQGLAWDSRGQLWETEFGENSQDELNLIQKGGNFGWPSCEGTQGNCAGYVAPKQTWSTSQGGPSAIEIVNDWIYVAAVTGERLYVAKINSSGTGTDTPKSVFAGKWGRLRTVVRTPDGGLWLSSTNDDKNGGSPSTLDNVIVRLKFPGGNTPGAFKLSSPAFGEGATVPAKYTCAGDGKAGQDTSPPLTWGASAGAKGYAIVFADTANNGNKLHWAIWDIPAATGSLPEGLGAGYSVPGGGGAKQKAMGSGADAQKFFGPCPGGSSHPYSFTLYALNTATVPGLSASSTMAQIESAIKGASTTSTRLTAKSNASAG